MIKMTLTSVFTTGFPFASLAWIHLVLPILPVSSVSIRDFDPKLDGKGVDPAIFEDLPCVKGFPERLVAAEKIVAIQGSTLNYDRPNLAHLPDYLDELVVSYDNFTFFVKGVGMFVGVDYVGEYNYLAQGQVNNGFMNYERRELLAIECADDENAPINEDPLVEPGLPEFNTQNNTQIIVYNDSVSLRVTFREEVYFNYGADRVFRVGQHIHTFAPNSSLLLSYRSQLDPILIDVVSENVPTPEQMCNEAALRCTGEIFPYESLQECYETLTALPHSCTPNGERCYDCITQNSAFHGDTLQCRSLHMLSAKMRPTFHCAHLGADSAPCQPEACPAFSERKPLEDVRDALAPFDAGLSQWFQILEFIFGGLLFLIPLFSFLTFRRARWDSFSEAPSKSSKDAHRTSSVGTTLDAEAFPKLTCAFSLRFVVSEDQENVVSAKEIDFGGCKMTALSGKSGSGKSTLMKMICGFPQPHMTLRMNILSEPVGLVYVPQSSEMWPRFMIVRDILLFAAQMQGCDIKEYGYCIDALFIRDLLDQSFSTLSGGEQQRVHILANLIHREPSLIFMDEPISALDEDNAVACLELLHRLPLKHSFVIAMHQMTPRIQAKFDRELEIDIEGKKLIKKHYTAHSAGQAVASVTPVEETTNNSKKKSDEGSLLEKERRISFLDRVRSLFSLWHALFWAWPAIDVGVLLLGIVTSVILGAMGSNSLKTDGILVDFVPSQIGTRIPVFLMQFLANIAALSAFVVGLVYSFEDRKILVHFSKQGKLRPIDIIVFNLIRFAYYGIIFGTVLLAIPLSMMKVLEGVQELDTMIFNAAFFSTGYTMVCYVLAQAVPPLYSSQVLLLTFLPMTLFTGVFFPWDTLSTLFQILHYLNPMFWCLTANAHLLLQSFDANCNPSADPYITCALSDAIADISQLQDLNSTHSQLVSMAMLVIGMTALYFMHRQVRGFVELLLDPKDEDQEKPGLQQHQSMYFTGGERKDRRIFMRRGSRMRQSTCSWVDIRMSIAASLENEWNEFSSILEEDRP